LLGATDATDEPTEEDERLYRRIVSQDIAPALEARLRRPERVLPAQREVLAVHWHSEHVPLAWIDDRIAAMFPNREEELIIPTNHNALTARGDYAGVEVDCYSRPFRRKVQLLIHFGRGRVEGDRAATFRSMLAHTFRYREGQLFDLFHALIAPDMAGPRAEAADRAGTSEEVVGFVRVQAKKLRALLFRMEAETPREAVRNKLIKWFFDGLRERFDPHLIDRCQSYIQQAKEGVKRAFDPRYFYETEEVIAEARRLGGAVIIPHPEQFWPILLADYDVDAYEVWNPQSREYTEFLIDVVRRHSRERPAGRRPLLVTMGDDCHVGEKAKEPALVDAVKASREVGVQPAWDDLAIQESLTRCGLDRRRVIREYKARLAG
jgi:hypothetical protein